MITKKIGKHTVVFYDSAEDLPIRKYQKLNKNLMIASQVGDTIADYDTRQGKVITFLKKDMPKEAAKEMQNQRQCFYNALEEYSPSSVALAQLVYSIDGIVYLGRDNATISQIIAKLDEIGFTKKGSTNTLKEVKKKLIPNLDYISLITFLTILLFLIVLGWKCVKLIWSIF